MARKVNKKRTRAKVAGKSYKIASKYRVKRRRKK